MCCGTGVRPGQWVVSWVGLGTLEEQGPNLARSEEDFQESNLN